MSLRLSTKEVTQLQAALTILVSPLDFPSVDTWRAESRRTIARLVQAETSVSFLPLPGEQPYQADRTIDLALYAEHFYPDDFTASYAQAKGSHAFSWDSMRGIWERPDRTAWLRSEFRNDWVRPQRLCQPCGLIAVRSSAELPCPPFPDYAGLAGLWFYQDRDKDFVGLGAHNLGILQLLLPGFEAGLHLVVRSAQERGRIASVLDTIRDAAMVVDGKGHIIHENPALGRVLSNNARVREIEATCLHAGRVVLASVRRTGMKSAPFPVGEAGAERIETSGGVYRVRATVLGAGILGAEPMALVLLERAVPEPLSAEDLHDQYELTDREVTVARLLARGLRDREVAGVLGVAIHTARRHSERVLRKLGVHSRAAVAGKLQSL